MPFGEANLLTVIRSDTGQLLANDTIRYSAYQHDSLLVTFACTTKHGVTGIQFTPSMYESVRTTSWMYDGAVWDDLTYRVYFQRNGTNNKGLLLYRLADFDEQIGSIVREKINKQEFWKLGSNKAISLLYYIEQYFKYKNKHYFIIVKKQNYSLDVNTLVLDSDFNILSCKSIDKRKLFWEMDNERKNLFKIYDLGEDSDGSEIIVSVGVILRGLLF